MSAAVRAFPWQQLPRVERAALEARRELLGRVAASVDLGRLSRALVQLLGDDVLLADVVLAERRSAPAPSIVEAHVIQFPGLGLRVALWPEPDLTRACVARLLGQGFELGWADTGIDAALRGAGAALALEVARRAARGDAPQLCPEAEPRSEWGSAGHATLRLGGKPYRVALRAEAVELGRPLPEVRPPALLSRLGALPLRVPWVGALSTATVSDVESLGVGDVWVPGEAAWVGADPLGAGLLAAPGSERGLPARISGGRIVLGAEAVPMREERTEELRRMGHEESELVQIVGETPVVVRLELGSVELSAAEWAGLRPGDVLSSGRRLGGPVVLRAGGREIARGELVDIEGELGVRITQVAGVAAAP